MEFQGSILIKAILVLQCFSILCASQSQDFDFFYFVQQWPGSYCDSKKACCYPTTGKPDADFGIHGLWPNYKDGTYPSNCDPSKPFDESQISGLTSSLQKNWPTLACPSGDGITFWTHEWEKHGTCSESVLNQHDYFETTLNLKQKANLLKALTSAGINADGGSYSLSNIKTAIQDGVGFAPFIECNRDSSGNSQLYQVYLCVDNSGSDFIDCPVFPHGKCGPEIEFPTF
ncbi:ribonuclease 1-like [Cicer arietinum]|uniref:Ribonuclease 1-like n=1 Tax=Cicer arietinum TaxID=3827 RepID=Q9ZQX1_CICAR|nr:ribonuclease 1-like precursor [Cicer arietinum]XP_004490066.1 ribonuclease 1-like [Cicer arietinum]CAA10130.1 ribonuclease T2 [Cicer arietinum]